MTAALVQRQVALAAIALLAAVGSLALAGRDGGQRAKPLPQPLPAAGGGWYTALAGPGQPRYGRQTRCGFVIEAGTAGVTDSVLPCGVLLYVAYKDSPFVLTRVVDHRPVVAGRKFELTPKLAEQLGVDGVQRIRWAFAR